MRIGTAVSLFGLALLAASVLFVNASVMAMGGEQAAPAVSRVMPSSDIETRVLPVEDGDLKARLDDTERQRGVTMIRDLRVDSEGDGL